MSLLDIGVTNVLLTNTPLFRTVEKLPVPLYIEMLPIPIKSVVGYIRYMSAVGEAC
jgi:hypothetical protein